MITLRADPNVFEAGLARAHLEGAGIPCDTADENTNVNTMAQFAIPVRLLVAEERVDEARRILDSQAATDSPSPNE